MIVGVIGPGTMGKAITLEWLKAGYETILICKNENQSVKVKESLHQKLERVGQLEALGLLRVASKLEELSRCDLIIESITEDINLKHQLIEKLIPHIKDDVILATNTSSLLVSDIFKNYPFKKNTLGMHFFNPPHKMKLIELIQTSHTSKSVIKNTESILYQLDKVPLLINDSPGFMVNRLLIPFINHACDLLDEGFSSIEKIDEAMMNGANHPIGPFKLADLIGIDVVVSILENLNQYNKGPKPHAILLSKIAMNKLGIKSGEGFYKYPSK